MNILIVVSDADDWPINLPGVTALPARTYLMDPSYGDLRSTKVLNLCRTIRYQSHGYYVSLLAEARGHSPVPDAQTMKDVQSSDLVAEVSARLGDMIDCALRERADDKLDLDIHFGRPSCGRHAHLAAQLFAQVRAPLLHARFERVAGRWRLCALEAGSMHQMALAQREQVAEAALAWLKESKFRPGGAGAAQPRIAILHDPARHEAPSNAAALQKFVEAAAVLGMHAELVTPRQARRLHDWDALFIRATTNVNHYTYQLARQARAAGMVVIDDPDAILRCTNKIYLDELLARHHIPTPKTMVVHRDNVETIVPALGLPCVLKQPDSAFSQGVAKIESPAQLADVADRMLQSSELLLAQEFLPTEFDWRIGVLDGRALFVCKYYMAVSYTHLTLPTKA